nr:probable L-gulonolactone oxidase 6 [Ipomoea batatas]GMD95160.1 probable L-gulonolactone oxidase 6 [Ipomoea batatas]GME09717.1 probable L-gulonolactone oxidase 6 [Ipomoea batatas]
MKVATRFSHSIPKLVCLDAENGLLISTKYLNRTLRVDSRSMRMTVESGVSLRQVISEAAKVGLALPYSPYWWGLTIGGMMGTGAHGSTLWGLGSAVHDHVVQIRIVTPATPEKGYATVRQLGEGDPEINAARVSLGVLGVISQVTLKLEPMFKRSITYVEKDDATLGDEAGVFGTQHEFGDMIWFPSERKVMYRIDDRVPTNASGDGLNDFIGFRSTLSTGMSATRSAEERQEEGSDANGKCTNAKIINLFLKAAAFGLTNNGVIFTGYPVIGYQNRLQSSGSCLDSLEDGLITACPWDPRIHGLFFHQTTFSITLSKVKGFIEDVQNLVNLQPKSLCVLGLYNGILMRYVTASTAYLGKQENAIDFDITYFRSQDPLAPRLFQDVLEEIEQLAVFKYGALPHWGKNRNVAFLGAVKKYAKSADFLEVKQKYDPAGLFSSDWTDQVLGLKQGLVILKEGCASEGLCICSQDSHCAPSKGYFCGVGKVYEKARVCRSSTVG